MLFWKQNSEINSFKVDGCPHCGRNRHGWLCVWYRLIRFASFAVNLKHADALHLIEILKKWRKKIETIKFDSTYGCRVNRNIYAKLQANRIQAIHLLGWFTLTANPINARLIWWSLYEWVAINIDSFSWSFCDHFDEVTLFVPITYRRKKDRDRRREMKRKAKNWNEIENIRWMNDEFHLFDRWKAAEIGNVLFFVFIFKFCAQ